MKQKDDNFTTDLFAKVGRGRPRDPNAKTAAQRAKEYRARKKACKFDFLRGARNEF